MGVSIRLHGRRFFIHNPMSDSPRAGVLVMVKCCGPALCSESVGLVLASHRAIDLLPVLSRQKTHTVPH